MKTSFLLAPFLAAAVARFLVAASAQDSAPPPAFGMTIEQAVEQIRAVDAGTKARVDQLVALVDQEAGANRLAEPVASKWRDRVRPLSKMLGFRFSPVLPADLTATDDAALAVAAKSFTAEWNHDVSQRNGFIQAAKDDVQSRMINVLRTAGTVQEIDAFLASIDQLNAVMPNHKSQFLPAPPTENFPLHRGILLGLRKVLELQSSPSGPDPQALGSALVSLEQARWDNDTMMCRPYFRQRVQDAVVPYVQARNEAQEVVDGLLQAGKPVSEITPALQRFEVAATRLSQVWKTLWDRPPSQPNDPLNIYRDCVRVMAALEVGDAATARKTVDYIRKMGLPWEDAVRTVMFAKLLATWDQGIIKAAAKAEPPRDRDLRARLAAIRSADELQAFAVELSKAEQQPREARSAEVPQGLANRLGAMGNAWAASDPRMLQQTGAQIPVSYFAAEFDELQQRIERDIVTASLRVPELNQAPLSELPLPEALDKLMTQLAAKGAWRRLLQIVDGHLQMSSVFLGADSDLSQALRAYIQAQNLELSDQWRDAQFAYKAVLRSPHRLAPIQETATRLKALAKEHPSTTYLVAPVPK